MTSVFGLALLASGLGFPHQFAWSPPRPLLAGDARCAAELTEDGEYTIVLHDRQFRGGADRFFRLKVGDLQNADLVFPLGVQLGKPAALQLLTVGQSDPVSATVDASQAGPRPARVDLEQVLGFVCREVDLGVLKEVQAAVNRRITDILKIRQHVDKPPRAGGGERR